MWPETVGGGLRRLRARDPVGFDAARARATRAMIHLLIAARSARSRFAVRAHWHQVPPDLRCVPARAANSRALPFGLRHLLKLKGDVFVPALSFNSITVTPRRSKVQHKAGIQFHLHLVGGTAKVYRSLMVGEIHRFGGNPPATIAPRPTQKQNVV